MTGKRWKIHEIKDRGWGLYDLIDTEKNRKYQFDVTDRGVRELVITLLNELSEENEQLKKARKFFEETLFNVIYATADYQRLTLNEELLEVIDEVDSLDELREKANFGIEEFKEEHEWL